MQARRFPARQGLVWLKQGFAMWRGAPIVLTGACLTMAMLLLVSAVLPVIGQVLPALLLPPLGVGIYLLCAQIRHAGVPAPGFLFKGFRLNAGRLFALGALRLVVQLGCVLLASQIAGLDSSAPMGQVAADGTVTMAPHMQSFVIWVAVLGLPLELCLWFAPQLIALANLTVAKSVFFSIVACWRNLGAILVCTLLWGLIFGLLPALLLNLLGSVLPALGSLLVVPLMLVMMPVFYASFYVCASEVFDGELRA